MKNCWKSTKYHELKTAEFKSDPLQKNSIIKINRGLRWGQKMPRFKNTPPFLWNNFKQRTQPCTSEMSPLPPQKGKLQGALLYPIFENYHFNVKLKFLHLKHLFGSMYGAVIYTAWQEWHIKFLQEDTHQLIQSYNHFWVTLKFLNFGGREWH